MGRGKSVNRSELARICGVSLPTLDNWINKGCPWIESPRQGAKGWVFDSAQVIEWQKRLAAQEAAGDVSTLNLDEARRRKTAAEAALAEMELAEKRRDFVRVEDAAKIAGEGYTRVRARLLSMPGRLAPLLAIADTPEECLDLVTGCVHEALAELAVGDDGADDPDAERPGGASPDARSDAAGPETDAQAPAEAQGKRLGRRKKTAKPRVQRGARTVEDRPR